MKYTVEYAKFVKVDIEADTEKEAERKADILGDDYIDEHCRPSEPCGYITWNVKASK